MATTPSGIDPQKIIEESGEDDAAKVFDIDLQDKGIATIENLGQFTKVKVLNLGVNAIQKIENLEACKELRELKLHSNQIKVIEGLDSLRQLTRLCLQHNQIKEVGGGLKALKLLKSLRLDSNCLSSLANIPTTLTTLDIGANNLTSLQGLDALVSLEELFAADNKLSDISGFSKCKKLEEIDLSGNNITSLAGLKGFSSLKIIRMGRNKLTSLDSLPALSGVEELHVPHNHINTLGALGQRLPSVEICDLKDNHLRTPEDVAPLHNVENLVELYLEGNEVVKGDAKASTLSALANAIASLEVIDGTSTKALARPRTSSGARPGTSAGVRPGTSSGARPTTASLGGARPPMRADSATLAGLTLGRPMDDMTASFKALDSTHSKIKMQFDMLNSSISKLVDDSKTEKRDGADISKSLESLSLASEGPRPPTSSSDRPSTSRSRMRIQSAKAFGDQHFTGSS